MRTKTCISLVELTGYEGCKPKPYNRLQPKLLMGFRVTQKLHVLGTKVYQYDLHWAMGALGRTELQATPWGPGPALSKITGAARRAGLELIPVVGVLKQ